MSSQATIYLGFYLSVRTLTRALLNERNDFKINKLKFLYELEPVKELIVLCKGIPNLLNPYLDIGFGH